MSTRLVSVVFDAAEPARLARFWVDALGWEITVEKPDEIAVEAEAAVEWGDGSTPCLTFVPVEDPKRGKNRVHIDLSSEDTQDQRDTVDRLLALGATRADIGQGDVPWAVLADPEGNEFCVLSPQAEYQGVGGVSAVIIDSVDPRRLGPFWSEATGWPVTRSTPELVALEHREEATTRLELLAVTEPKRGKNRLHIDIAPSPRGDLAEEVARLEAAGGRHVDVGQGDVSWSVLADPEGNEFCALSPR